MATDDLVTEGALSSLVSTIVADVNSVRAAGGSTDPEVVRDTIGSALMENHGASVAVDDAANTITIGGEPGTWDPAQLGFLAWNYDIAFLQAGTVLGANGTTYVQKLWTPRPISVTNLHVQVVTAGATLTAGQNFATLYDASKNKLGVTADQQTAWQSIGTKTMALIGGPFSIPAGYFYVTEHANGTTRPSFARLASNIGGINGLLSAANSRWASANTGQTTTTPATLGTFTATNVAYWAAVS